MLLHVFRVRVQTTLEERRNSMWRHKESDQKSCVLELVGKPGQRSMKLEYAHSSTAEGNRHKEQEGE